MTGGSRMYVFLSLHTSSQAVYLKVKAAFRLAIVLVSLAAISLVAGLVGKRYAYALTANLVPVLLPLVVLEGAQQRMWGKELLKTQCLLATVYGLTMIILDSIILAFIVTNFRYCYGSWNDQCDSYEGSGSVSLICRSPTAPSTSNGLFVTCDSRENYILQLISLGLNLIHSLGIAPYLLLCHALRTALNSSMSTWEDGSIIVLDPLPDAQEVAASRVLVLAGREEVLEEEEAVEGLPVAFKSAGDVTDESRDEIAPPRVRMKMQN